MSEVALFGELATLGVAGFDPVGVAIMPVLLAQRNGVMRAWMFLAGSACALMVTGLLGAAGLGKPIVHLGREYPWLDHAVELLAAAVLLPLGAILLARARHAGNRSEAVAPVVITDRLGLPTGLLFVFGYLLVTVQSLADVAFLLAMADLGSQRLKPLTVLAAVATYAAAALAVQVAVVVGYQYLPGERRARFTRSINGLLSKHGDQIAAILMLGLGVALAAMAIVGLIRA